MIETLALLAVRGFFGALSLLPVAARVRLVSALIRIAIRFMPRYRKIARRNLEFAFPELDDGAREQIYQDSFHELARMVVDFGRLPTLDRAWLEAHVELPDHEALFEAKRRSPKGNVIYACGHAGSFELHGFVMGLLGIPVRMVMRPFSLHKLSEWWRAQRELSGNRAIMRDGAFRTIVDALRAGDDVAVLFDQNVTRDFATFVPWFSKAASTTKIVAISGMRTKTPIVASAFHYIGDGRYRLRKVPIDLSDLEADRTMTMDKKVDEATRRIAEAYTNLIREQPPAWFWFHRRWKTRPEGEPENLYA